MPARDLEGDHHAVSRGKVGDIGTNRLDDAHRLVAQDQALGDEGGQDLVEVQVRTADSRSRHAHDCVGGILNRGIGHIIYPNVSLAVRNQHFQLAFVGLLIRMCLPGTSRRKRRHSSASTLRSRLYTFECVESVSVLE